VKRKFRFRKEWTLESCFIGESWYIGTGSIYTFSRASPREKEGTSGKKASRIPAVGGERQSLVAHMQETSATKWVIGVYFFRNKNSMKISEIFIKIGEA
jgi:hypothetical protein